MFKISADKIFRRTKLFGGQHFRQQVRFSAVLSAEPVFDKILIEHWDSSTSEKETERAHLQNLETFKLFV